MYFMPLRLEACPTAGSIPVGVGLVGALPLDTNVISLRLRQLGQLGTQRWEVQIGNLLIKRLRQQIDIILVTSILLRVPQEVELAKDLVGERPSKYQPWQWRQLRDPVC